MKKYINFCFTLDNSYFLDSEYSFFDIGYKQNYFDEEKTIENLNKFCDESILPANRILLAILQRLDARFSFVISNTLFQQLEDHRPDVIKSFEELNETGAIEFLVGCNTLASMCNAKEFERQLKAQKKYIKKYFSQEPVVFLNHHLIYSDAIGEQLHNLGFKGVLAEGAKSILGWRSPNFVYQPAKSFKLKLLFRNYHISDLVTFHFNGPGWHDYSLDADKFANIALASLLDSRVLNLFVDYSQFGCGSPKESGIFDFLFHLPFKLLKEKEVVFKTPSEIIKKERPVAKISVEYPSSSVGQEKDVTRWLGNDFQQAMIESIYHMRSKMEKKKNLHLKPYWDKLQHADYFSFMDTQWKDPQDEPMRNNPFTEPEFAYVAFNNIINDLSIRAT